MKIQITYDDIYALVREKYNLSGNYDIEIVPPPVLPEIPGSLDKRTILDLLERLKHKTSQMEYADYEHFLNKFYGKIPDKMFRTDVSDFKERIAESLKKESLYPIREFLKGKDIEKFYTWVKSKD